MRVDVNSPGHRVNSALRTVTLLACAAAAGPVWGQSLRYVEPNNAACPVRAVSSAAAPKKVKVGAAVPGTLSVTCGFEQGSYTVTLYATDPGATFTPKSLLVNFGSIAAGGRFNVRFATPGVHTLSAVITSNMGSPAVVGRFEGLAHRFDVAGP